MKRFHVQGRTLAMIAVLAPLLILFVYVALRSGPMAPVPVTVTTVEDHAIQPALFGIGTVESRYTYRIGPTLAGRVKRLDVDVGDTVRAGQVLGEMDPVDLDDRVAALDAALKRAAAQVVAAEAQIRDAEARKTYAGTQAHRYKELLQARTVSEESLDAKQQEQQVSEAGLASAQANLEAARQERTRIGAELAALTKQRANLRLIAPADGLVVTRDAEPGTTVVAGQPVIEAVDPGSLWINVRFDQASASGLRAGLPGHIVLRSQGGQDVAGRVLRVEPLADSVTEEILAKVAFDSVPEPLPPIGELAEVTVALPARPTGSTLPNACVLRVNGHLGVWRIEDGTLRFSPVTVGARDLDGRIQILDGLKPHDRVVVHSRRALTARDRIQIADHLYGEPR
ncbi:MAG TPA: efflux transporter periplasmic adaptor subunit [Verrucomicrobia bacterium]|nr:efflux transporter periplasmic adaptor subunit [Verrucomicrobiota bacterium]